MRPAATIPPAESALRRHAESVVSECRYLVLATSTLSGTPWATPVYFATTPRWTFWWVSSPDTRHSRNIAVNPHVALTVFDSSVEVGKAAAVYVEAWADQCPPGQVPGALDAFNERSVTHGGSRWEPSRVTGAARLRLYRATAIRLDVLNRDDGPDRRIPVWPPTGSPG